MGTSRGYAAPTGGNWPSVKRLITEFGEGGEEDPDPHPPLDPENPVATAPPAPLPRLSPRSVLARYIQAHGGGAASAGGGSGGGGSSGGSSRARAFGRAATRVGQDLGGFASRASEAGLATALDELGLGDMVGRSAAEVLTGLLDRLCGPGSTIDEALARAALNRLRQELFEGTQTFEDVDRRLREIVGEVQAGGLVMQFYGHYLYEKFARDSYERLLKSHGPEKARRSMESIRRTIASALRTLVGQRDPIEINWRGAEGRQLAETILTRTLNIFLVPG